MEFDNPISCDILVLNRNPQGLMSEDEALNNLRVRFVMMADSKLDVKIIRAQAQQKFDKLHPELRKKDKLGFSRFFTEKLCEIDDDYRFGYLFTSNEVKLYVALENLSRAIPVPDIKEPAKETAKPAARGLTGKDTSKEDKPVKVFEVVEETPSTPAAKITTPVKPKAAPRKKPAQPKVDSDASKPVVENTATAEPTTPAKSKSSPRKKAAEPKAESPANKKVEVSVKLANKPTKKADPKSTKQAKEDDSSDHSEEEAKSSSANKKSPAKKSNAKSKAATSAPSKDDDSSDDDIPLSKIAAKASPSSKKPATKPKAKLGAVLIQDDSYPTPVIASSGGEQSDDDDFVNKSAKGNKSSAKRSSSKSVGKADKSEAKKADKKEAPAETPKKKQKVTKAAAPDSPPKAASTRSRKAAAK